MTTQYTPILKLALPVTGELSGTWGDVVNDNITSMVEQAIAGLATINTWTANSHTLTTADGTTSESRCAMLVADDDGGGNPSAAAEIICPASTKIYILKNISGQQVTLKTSGGSGVAVPNNNTMFLFCDGTNVIQAVTRLESADIDFAKLKGTGAVFVTNILDEDNMASDSATALATQQSIKAYVDSQVGTVDTWAEVLANGNTSGGTDVIISSGDDLTLSGGTANGVLYLNGSKVATSGSGLTYNGSTLATTGALTVDGNTTLGNATTDTVTVNGYMGVGGAPNAGRGVSVVSSDLTGTAQDGIVSQVVGTSAATSRIVGFNAIPSTAAGAFTTTNLVGFRVANVTKGAGSTITNYTGVEVGDLTQGTNNYGITSAVSSGANKWNIYASGTAQNYFAGNTLFGASGTPTTSITISKSAASAWMNATNGTVDNYFGVSNSASAGNMGTITNHPLTLSTNNTERLRIDSSGNVGIGTSSPATKFVLSANNGGTVGGAPLNVFRFNDTDDTVAPNQPTGRIEFYVNDVDASGTGIGSYIEGLAAGYAGGGYLTFATSANGATGAAERMRIDSSGNVGIGTSSPTNTLSVSGNANITGNTTLGDASTDTVTVNGYMGVGGAGNAGYGVFQTNSALTGTTQNGFGSFPVGTSSATSAVRAFVAQPATAASSFTAGYTAGFYAGDAAKGAGSTITNQHGLYITDQTQGTNNYGITSLVSSGTNKWNIYASGTAQNLFAGHLNLSSGVSTTQYINYGDGTTNYARLEGGKTGSGQGSLIFHTYLGGTLYERMRIDSSGNVGIGTSSPDGKLHVLNGSAGSVTANGNADELVVENSSNGGLSILTPDASTGYIIFGSPSDNEGAIIRYNQSGALMTIGTEIAGGQLLFRTGSGSERLRIDSSGNVLLNQASSLIATNTADGADSSVLAISGGGAAASTRGGFIELYGNENGSAGIVELSSGNVANSYVRIQGRSSTSYIRFDTNSTERMRIDSSGNLGLGVTPSAWVTGYSGRVMQIGDAAAFGGSTNDSLSFMSANAFYDSVDSRWEYINTDYATLYEQLDSQHKWYIASSGTAGNAITFTQAMTLDASGNLGIGTSSPSSYSFDTGVDLVVGDGTNSIISVVSSSTGTGYVAFADGTSGTARYSGLIEYNHTNNYLVLRTNATERARIDSSGNLLVGGTSQSGTANKVMVKSADKFGLSIIDTTAQATGVGGALNLGGNYRSSGDAQAFVRIAALKDNSTDSNYAYSMGFYTTPNGGTFTERMRIDSSGNLLVGTTSASISSSGLKYEGANGALLMVRDGNTPFAINRLTNDGNLIEFYQATSLEGTISVSGTTVSYNGGHLSRWSQTTDNTRIPLVKGTVMSNLDQMANWDGQANEQLNCMKVSDVEGDVNVAGVFVNWDNDDDEFTNDMNIAMTGDMIIRIAQGTVVQRGDLLMSAGDGTAKPQGDDIVRSKTVAKVTSTHITCTYDDGSYCVPCVLMAC